MVDVLSLQICCVSICIRPSKLHFKSSDIHALHLHVSEQILILDKDNLSKFKKCSF